MSISNEEVLKCIKHINEKYSKLMKELAESEKSDRLIEDDMNKCSCERGLGCVGTDICGDCLKTESN